MKSPNSNIPKENKFIDELIISIFYEIDNFWKEFQVDWKQHCLSSDGKKVSLEPSRSLSVECVK